MKLLAASVGSYPRLGDSYELQLVRRSIRKWEMGKISDEELEESQQHSARWAIEEQESAGLDIVTDGLVRWYDQYSHLGGRLGGCEVNGLVRFADTNYYVREVVIKDKVCWIEPVLKPEYDLAAQVTLLPVKMVLTGPLTMAHHTIDEGRIYSDRSVLVNDYAVALASEVSSLAASGCRHIQIDEPLIHWNAGWLEDIKRSLEVIYAQKGEAELSLCVYFGDAAPCYDSLQMLPVDTLHLDFTYSPSLVSVIESQGSDKRLGLGLIDGRNTRLERPEDLIPVLEIVARTQGEAILAPSCGLEYLPRDRARSKLERLVQIRDLFAGGDR